MESLRSNYAICLGVDASEFLMSQLSQKAIKKDSNGREYYPEKCLEAGARRYMMYYQDCLLVTNISLWGENKSPMFSFCLRPSLASRNSRFFEKWRGFIRGVSGAWLSGR